MEKQAVAVIGAGTMGSGIAQKIAQEGIPVVLVDSAAAAMERGRRLVTEALDQAIARRILDAAAAAATVARITFTTDLARAAECGLCIEAVFEDIDVKRGVFAALDAACGPDTILASNTSSLSVGDLAAMTNRPDRVIGLHYFYHPAKNRLVEIVPTDTTSGQTIARAAALQDAIGKTAIRSADRPGFIVNRFFVPWLNEAVRLLAEGTASIPDIEAAAKAAFGIGMGPFELMNVTGVPIALHAAGTLGRKLGPLYAPAPRLAQQAAAGAPWPLDGAEDPARAGVVVDHLEGAVFFIAASLVAEGVASMEDTDIGARVGLRWPAGPFERMNRRGTRAAARLAAAFAERWSLPLPGALADIASAPGAGAPFRFQRVRLDVDDGGIASITINRPDALNALDEEVVAQLGERVDEALARADVRGIVLRGAGKAFVAGADLKFFVDRMAEQNYARIEAFARAGQRVLHKLDHSPKPVVAVLDGLALGGGTELALAADAIVATDRGSLGFPETGIGIYPGLGGTQRTTRRVGVGLTRWLVLTGQTVDAKTALEIGLIDRVVDRAALADTVRALALGGPAPPRAVPAAPPASARYRGLADFFTCVSVDDLLAGRADTGADADAVRAAKQVKAKAPIAARLAARIIDEGAALPLDEALELENHHAREVFASADAREGMAALLARRRPAFSGA